MDALVQGSTRRAVDLLLGSWQIAQCRFAYGGSPRRHLWYMMYLVMLNSVALYWYVTRDLVKLACALHGRPGHALSSAPKAVAARSVHTTDLHPPRRRHLGVLFPTR